MYTYKKRLYISKADVEMWPQVIDEAEALRELIIQVDAFDTLSGQDHKGEWMKATWSVGPIDASAQQSSGH